MQGARAAGSCETAQQLDVSRAPMMGIEEKGSSVRTTFSKLLRSFSPVLTVAVLVAVAGLGGTAMADHGKGNGNGNGNGDDNTVTTTATTTDTAPAAALGSTGDKGDWGDKTDRHGKSHWKPKHHKKNQGDDDTDYGVATVNVSRGHSTAGVQNAATTWATYSTALGSPVGDNTGGVFRFTCTTVQAPCTVAVAAAVLSDNHDNADFYPRVLIYRQDYVNPASESYCEYGDGSVGAAPVSITAQPLTATPTYTPVMINIGGSADCSGPVPTAGDVSVITVGAGYYDVHSTFVFVQ
jgi:hypothetical protein